MSGGSYDYAYEKVNQFADSLQNTHTCPHRAAFADLCRRVARAMHDIEWVDSCDYGGGQEMDAIRLALGSNADAIVLAKAIEQAEASLARFKDAIAKAKESQQ